MYTIKYDLDNTDEDLEEEELRPLIYTQEMPARKAIVNSLKAGFDYLENRLLGNCDPQCAFRTACLRSVLTLRRVSALGPRLLPHGDEASRPLHTI